MAINVTELRIGNLIQYNDDSTIFQVKEIGSSGLGVESAEESTWIEIDQFSPIPLTPEILEKAGLISNFTNEWSLKSNASFAFKLENNEYRLLLATNGFAKKYKYVHEVQNLYHAFTGEELSINL